MTPAGNIWWHSTFVFSIIVIEITLPEPAIAQGFGSECTTGSFAATNHRYRTKLAILNSEQSVEPLRKWTAVAHCNSRSDGGRTISFGARKAVFFEIGNGFSSAGRSCMALQAVGMASMNHASGIQGFWRSGRMSPSQAQTVNSYLRDCLENESYPLGRSRAALYEEVVTRLGPPSGMSDDLRTTENVRISAGARLAQSLLDSLYRLLELDFGKSADEHRAEQVATLLRLPKVRGSWHALWTAMAGSSQSPVRSCLRAIGRARSSLERDLMKARALAGAKGTC